MSTETTPSLPSTKDVLVQQTSIQPQPTVSERPSLSDSTTSGNDLISYLIIYRNALICILLVVYYMTL